MMRSFHQSQNPEVILNADNEYEVIFPFICIQAL